MANEKDKLVKEEERRKQYASSVKNMKELYSYRSEWLKQYVAEIEAANAAATKGDTSHTSGSASYIASGMDWEELRDMPLKGSSGLTAEQIDEWIKAKVGNRDSIMLGMGEAFIEAERVSGNRADAILAHAAVESGWGTSSIVKEKFNWFGIGAFDSSPYKSAHSFNGAAGGIVNGAAWIADNYTNSTKYKQDTYRKMRWNNGVHQYATDTKWDEKICKIWSGAPAPINGIGTDTNVADQNIDGFIKITGGKVSPPTGSRSSYNSTLAGKAHKKGVAGLQQLPTDKFSSNLNGCTMAVAKEFYPGILLIYEKMKSNNLLTGGKMLINSAYRYKDPDQAGLDYGAHGWGGAIDIGAKGKENALAIADIAWTIGFRAVAVGGSINSGLGFVHVDAGPPGSWSYGYGKYQGPGTM